MAYELLERVNTPKELRELPEEEIPRLSTEIREFLIEKVGSAGGHLASNLGVVELTLAMHRVFDSPHDHFVFDVGHQAYVHKMLTGRRDRFDTLRAPGGLSGFTSIFESQHDAFGAGHSSTAISAGLGLACADRLSGSDAYTVCVVGDGAYTGGMAHEALNNIDPDLRLIVILNENGMSISRNKGAFAQYLSRVRMSSRYVRLKENTRSFLNKIPLGKYVARAISAIKKKIKSIIYPINYFEELGLYYLGGIDGNDYKATEKALRDAKAIGKSVVVHLKTQKGRGYSLAEDAPDKFHSVKQSENAKAVSYGAIVCEELSSAALNDEKIVAVTAAMGIGTSLSEFGEKYPERYFDVGIAEGHALTFSAGLARAGYKPYAAIYSTFLQRGYDSILHDVARQGLPVRIIVDRAGLSLGDGETHHGIFDVSFLSHIPNVKIFEPLTDGSARRIFKDTLDADAPTVIRYSNSEPTEAVRCAFYPGGDYENYGIRYDFDIENPPENLIITYGNITNRVLSAKEMLEKEQIRVGILALECLKPTAPAILFITERLRGVGRILFVEEGIKNGGIGMISRDALCECGYLPGRIMEILAIEDNFAKPKEICDLYAYLGLSAEKIAEKFKDILKSC